MKRPVLILVLLVTSIGFAQAPKGYYRFPTIHSETIIFTSEGDLWRVGIRGGVAQRLTTHHSMETHAAISPDGLTVAFSGQYEGPTEVYTMPVQGGLPVQITYEGESALVVGWTPDGKILYSTRHYSTLPNTQLAIIDPSTLEQRLVPLSQASDGAFEAAGKTLFFTRLPFQGSRTKRYAGGTAQNLWKFTAGTPEAMPLTGDYAGTSKDAMWWDGRVYFASDRDGTMNLWSMDETGGDLKQLTFHRGWDIQSPDLEAGRIVYQLGADLYLFDIKGGTDSELNITLASDFKQAREKWIKDPMEYLSAAYLAADGENIALTARGRVFVAPARQGRLVEVTRHQGVRYREGRFLTANSLLLLSDASGEQEFWQYPANGIGQGKQLTKDATVLRFEGVPSPKGKRFAFTDKDQRLSIYDVATKTAEVIATSDWSDYSDLSWSPDGQWLAYVETVDNLNSQIIIYNVTEKTKITVTSDRVDSYSPTWSPDGQWLYFLSDRNFQSLVRSPWGPRQPEPFYDKTTKIYVLSLSKGERFPFQPKDEIFLSKTEKDKKSAKNKDKKEEKGDSEEAVQVKIDLAGLANRVMEVPVEAGNYGDLSVNSDRLFWTERETSLERKSNLHALGIGSEEKKPETIVHDLDGYELSQNGKKLLIQKGDNLFVIDASAGSSVKHRTAALAKLGLALFYSES
ncbi:MAG: protease, partial [bacterium]